MIASKWFDLVIGVDVHVVLVPSPAGPVPTPLPHPFCGLVFDPAGLVVGTAIAGGMAAFSGTFAGPAFINHLPVGNTGTEGTNKLVMPHFPMPPGTAWAPIPAAPKPPVPGKPPDPPAPTPMPSNDTVLITGSKTVHIGGTNAVRLGDLSMDCAEPIRAPTATVLALPMGPPVLVGGPPALDIISALTGSIRTKWVTGRLRRLLGAADGSWRSKLICMLTGHPVDVVSGMVVTDDVDFELPTGPVPLTFERTYYSKASGTGGPLGHGWSHSYNQRLRVEPSRIVLEASDGRELYFAPVADGQSTSNDSEELSLARTGTEIRIRDRDLLTYVYYRAGNSEFWPLVAIEDTRANRVTFRYDNRGLLAEVTDSAGRPAYLDSDELGRIVRIRLPHPAQPTEQFVAARYEYDEAGDLVAVHDALGNLKRYAYKHHLLVQETDANGLSFYFAYDGITPSARCVRTWGDGGIYDHVLTYDGRTRVTLKEDSYGARTLYFANDAGLVERMIDSLGRERKFAYDDALRRVTETDPLGAVVTMTYDRAGNITSIIDADGVGRALEYDDRRQPVREVMGGGEFQHDYNRFAELESSRNPVEGGMDVEFNAAGDPIRFLSRSGRSAELLWDSRRNLVQATLPGETPIRAHYDSLGRCTGVDLPDNRTVRYELDLNGRPVSVTRSWLGTDHFDYDAAGRIRRHIDPAGGELYYEYGGYNKITAMRSPVGGTRSFEYSLEGDPIAIRNEKGEAYRLERDSEGQIIREVDFSGRAREMRRDAAGNVIEIIEGPRLRTKLSWTPGGRLASIVYPDGCFDRFEYDGAGRIVVAENETGVLKREYDALGRLASETWADSRIDHAYDPDNLRTRSRTSDGLELEYSYDAGERLTRVRANGQHALHRSYDSTGKLLEVTSPGGLVQNFSYDANGHLRQQRVSHPRKGPVAYRLFEFSAGGALAGVFDASRGLKSYAYGPKGVERALRDGLVEESYVYDAAGDWLPEGRRGEVAGGGRLLRFGEHEYEYDERGRVISKYNAQGKWSFGYNDRGQLTSVKTPAGSEIRYEYDPFWRRVSRADGDSTIQWRWNGDAPLSETLRRGNEVLRARTFIFEPDGHVPLMVLEAGEVYSVVADHNGSPQEVVSRDGTVVWAGDYSVWGRLNRELDAGFTCPFRFPGQLYDEESGLHYNRFRYYDPDSGRYLTPDPIGLAGGLNSYAYVTDPLTWVDPQGLAGCVSRFFQSYIIFLKSGIRPKHVRAIMRVAMETGQTFAFRNIGSPWKRLGSLVAGFFGVRPKPASVKAKSNAVGIATDPSTGNRYRSDYDPAFYRNPDGSVMTDAEAAAANQRLNREIGSEEIQHPTHVTMPPEIAPQVGPPTTSTVFNPDGTTSQMTPDEIRDAPGMPWMWP